jgi:hypothetical protein
MSEKTLGEIRVQIDFNASGSSLVDELKRKSARLIDLCESMKPRDGSMMNGEKARLISLAQTHFEDAAMWAVKAATF